MIKEVEKERFGGYRLVLSVEAYQKLYAYVDKCEYEISGFGRGRIDSSTREFIINDVFILKQEVTGVTTNIDEAAQAKFQFEETQKGTSHEVFFWWHSHVNMAAFFSGVDVATIERSSNSPFLLSLVTNKMREFKCRFDLFSPVRETIEVDEFVIDYGSTAIDELVEKEMAEKVSTSWGQRTLVNIKRAGKRVWRETKGISVKRA